MKIVYQPSLALPTMKAEKNKKDIKNILEMTKRKQKQKYHSVTLFDYHIIKSFQYSVSQTGFLQNLEIQAYLQTSIENICCVKI